jgi:hypothetical protein
VPSPEAAIRDDIFAPAGPGVRRFFRNVAEMTQHKTRQAATLALRHSYKRGVPWAASPIAWLSEIVRLSM